MRRTKEQLRHQLAFLNMDSGYSTEFKPEKGKYLIDHNSTGYQLCRYTNSNSYGENSISPRIKTLSEFYRLIQTVRINVLYEKGIKK